MSSLSVETKNIAQNVQPSTVHYNDITNHSTLSQPQSLLPHLSSITHKIKKSEGNMHCTLTCTSYKLHIFV